MAANGQNTLLCQVENEDLDFYGGHRLSLEYPLGHYDEGVARQFDELLELARQHGIYVITYLWDTFHMDFAWAKSPYHVDNGGPCRYVSDMLRDPTARAWQKRKFRWAIDRWGNHPNLLAWELMNEIEWAVAGPIPGNAAPADEPLAIDMEDPIQRVPGRYRLATEAEMAEWVTDMGAFTRAYALERWGRAPLQTVSTNNPRYAGAWLYEHPALDFVTNHQYDWTDDLTTNPKHALDAALAVRDLVHAALSRARYRRPYMDTEHGPLGWHLQHPADTFPFDDALFHAMAWANWAAGAAGSGLRWPYPNYGFGGKPFLNPLSPVMERSLAAMAKVAGGVAWDRFDGRPASLGLDDPRLVAIASADAHQLIAWIAHDDRQGARPAAPARIGLPAGRWTARCYDDTTGELLSEAQVEGEIVTPAFERHLAMVLQAGSLGTMRV
jgi:hypothetical protein